MRKYCIRDSESQCVNENDGPSRALRRARNAGCSLWTIENTNGRTRRNQKRGSIFLYNIITTNLFFATALKEYSGSLKSSSTALREQVSQTRPFVGGHSALDVWTSQGIHMRTRRVRLPAQQGLYPAGSCPISDTE